MLPISLFVTGTDTGIGKTLVTALLALRIRQFGVDCAVLKPFASGCARENGVLVSEDAEFLRHALNLRQSIDEICPIRLEEPLAPLVAARRAGISTRDWPRIARDAFESLRQNHECVVVEGVGGLLAPIWEDENGARSNLDLMRDWDLPAVLVARRTLGTINHTRLCLNVTGFAGLVFNDAAPISPDDIAAQTSADFLAEISEVPVWGHVPFAPDFRFETLQSLARDLEIC